MFEQVIEEINRCESIAISFHVSPDGDAVGSSLALMNGLRKLGKKVNILCRESVPEILSFLPSAGEINKSTGIEEGYFDCLIVLDCGNIDRINIDFEINGDREYRLLNLDHHASNDYYGDVNYVDTKYSAMGEIVYLLLMEMGVEIDSDMAICLYTSIMTDCGSFKYSNTTSLTHNIAGALIDKKIDFPEIHRKIYENKKFELVKLAGKLIEGMYLQCNNRLCIIEAMANVTESLGVDPADVSDLVYIGTDIQGVEVVVFIKQNADKYKISLRSKKYFDVRVLAEKYGGGGHAKAAGFSYTGDLEKLKQDLIKMIGDSL
ncbi:MAG: bifunctional oligoribonuclease/PAP phosphatase NrnA [Bacillota bacterium]|nr:bifunctional oligoribonuclease/PAP phosphatase NrnA [Bacillota bacterium]